MRGDWLALDAICVFKSPREEEDCWPQELSPVACPSWPLKPGPSLCYGSEPGLLPLVETLLCSDSSQSCLSVFFYLPTQAFSDDSLSFSPFLSPVPSVSLLLCCCLLLHLHSLSIHLSMCFCLFSLSSPSFLIPTLGHRPAQPPCPFLGLKAAEVRERWEGMSGDLQVPNPSLPGNLCLQVGNFISVIYLFVCLIDFCG